MKRYSWTQPCCDHCWDHLFPDRAPTRLRVEIAERCVHCAEVTKSGIYIRINPDEAPFPTLMKDAS